ncbi:MAG: AAA family ATPase, partial [Candidatus Korarchaeota archaeon]|nr:AAA family ATPase [Candidatus Korarchaeota archaeon]
MEYYSTMGILKEVTGEYLGSLEYVREIPREFSLPIHSPDIVAILGPRRVGKTFLMLKEVKKLLESGDQALYIPFDEPLVRRMDAREFAELVRAEYPEGRVHLFLDEIQDWPDWGRKLRWMHEVKDFHLYVSGSSAALQSS